MIEALVAAVALGLLGHVLLTLWLMTYTWNHPERMAATRGPRCFRAPELGFTVLLPARDEEAVIAETVRKVAAVRYPSGLLEVRVICHADDESTIDAARAATAGCELVNVSVETFGGTPVNKPRGLNVGLAVSENEVVCVFDAEDDIHPDIFNVVNTVMLDEQVPVVQGGVQLVNMLDRWFSIHNCLEYYFWYKSRLHFHAGVGMIPLGGNTIFLRRGLVERVGGWDDRCLTEDADIGMRISALGVPIRVAYDQEWATREETPVTVGALVRQRTRWHQGFLQVLGKADWRRVPGWRRRALALFTFAQPLIDAAVMCTLPLAIVGPFFGGPFLHRPPVYVALLSFAPLYGLLLQMVTHMVGARMFARDFGLKLPATTLCRFPLTHLLYQFLLGAAAVRAVARHLYRRTDWEKTEHVGAHRSQTVPVCQAPGPAVEGPADVPIPSLPSAASPRLESDA
ncbi:glycosyltransferase [Actinomadura formosensis]|uniref:glycosyltransferase n=1 Tax=Actinomadura formosensis TaxID=60706 RepID=UPI0008375690|nr:glycosyltransferase [Actinomadura formosensis]